MNQQAAVSPILAVVDGRPITTSIDIAEKFEKRHKDVLRAIQKLECSDEFNRRNFAPVSYLDGHGQYRPMFNISRDGFAFLAMGFTGKAAAVWKERYIMAFNAMETELLARAGEPDRRVDVNHNHFRRTLSPAGLDIRYTLDLTRIVLSPTRKSLAVLEKLTGIVLDADDLVGEAASGVTGFASIGRYAATAILIADQDSPAADHQHRVAVKEVYAHFCQWYEAWADDKLRRLPSKRALTTELCRRGCRGQAMGGVRYLYGLRFVEELGQEVRS